jgi:hypothetical protein
MKKDNEKIFEAIGHISDSKIERADKTADSYRPNSPVRVIPTWRVFAPLVAACLIVAVGIYAVPRLSDDRERIIVDTQPAASGASESVSTSTTEGTPAQNLPQNLPKLSVDFNNTMVFGPGEIYAANDIAELYNANPWRADRSPPFLPVFRNQMRSDGIGLMENALTAEQTAAWVQMVMDALGLESSAEIRHSPSADDIEKIMAKLGPNAHPNDVAINTQHYRSWAECDNGVMVEVLSNGRVVVTLTPDTLEYAHAMPQISGALDQAGLDYTVFFEPGLPIQSHKELYDEYSALSPITTPRYNPHLGYFFENSGTLEERIINWNFNRFSFSLCDEAGFFAINQTAASLSDKIGDYPIITQEQALELLRNNEYYTSISAVYFDLTDAEPAKAELVYRSDPTDEFFMPFYRFLAEVDVNWYSHTSPTPTYGAFYVPAVHSDYLK